MGPREKAVRDGLSLRPASALYAELDREARETFLALFAARRRGYLNDNGSLTIGKAEAESGWPEHYRKLQKLGFIEFSIEQKPNHPDIGGVSRYLHWAPTPKGKLVRNDDLRWFLELIEAIRKDEGKL